MPRGPRDQRGIWCVQLLRRLSQGARKMARRNTTRPKLPQELPVTFGLCSLKFYCWKVVQGWTMLEDSGRLIKMAEGYGRMVETLNHFCDLLEDIVEVLIPWTHVWMDLPEGEQACHLGSWRSCQNVPRNEMMQCIQDPQKCLTTKQNRTSCMQQFVLDVAVDSSSVCMAWVGIHYFFCLGVILTWTCLVSFAPFHQGLFWRKNRNVISHVPLSTATCFPYPSDDRPSRGRTTPTAAHHQPWCDSGR